MKKLTFLQTAKGGMVKRIILLFLILVILMILYRDVSWAYYAFESGLGTSMAQVAMTYHMVLLLGMLTVGLGLGHLVNRMIRDRKAIFESPRKGGKTEWFIRLWGYEFTDDLPQQDEPIQECEPPKLETFDLFELPTRRGRKPTFTLEHWLPVAMKWENRDSTWDAFTLAELIAEHLGTNPDGSPIISEQTYYSVWRKRALAEMKRRMRSKASGETIAQVKKRA